MRVRGRRCSPYTPTGYSGVEPANRNRACLSSPSLDESARHAHRQAQIGGAGPNQGLLQSAVTTVRLAEVETVA